MPRVLPKKPLVPLYVEEGVVLKPFYIAGAFWATAAIVTVL